MNEDTPAMVHQLAEAAAAAFATARHSSGADRAAWLRAIADRLDAHVDELVAIADAETFLGDARLRGEVARTTGQLRLFADVILEGSYLEATIDHAVPTATPPRPDLRRMLLPLGPVAVFSASNFPFAFSVAGGDTASALAAGNPVIVKAHSGHVRLSQRTAELVTAALHEAGAPDGMFALTVGREAGVALVDHPLIQAVGFTGSVSGGRALYNQAAARPVPIPFYGELGSINPVVVTAAADAAQGVELAAGLAASFQLGVGQFCTKPGLVFVPEGSRLEASVAQHVGTDSRPMLTERIAVGFDAGIAELLAVPGAVLIAGEAPTTPAEGTVGAAARVISLPVGALDTHADTVLAEVFGPVTVLLRYRDEASLVNALGRLDGSLTATLHAAPGEPVAAILDLLTARAGRVLFAGWPTGVAVTWSQHHGGPYPATTSVFTSVGATAIRRFLRPITFQDAPEALLPAALQDHNPLQIPRRIDGALVLPAV